MPRKKMDGIFRCAVESDVFGIGERGKGALWPGHGKFEALVFILAMAGGLEPVLDPIGFFHE